MAGLPDSAAPAAFREAVHSLLASRRFATFLTIGALGAVVDNAVLIAMVETGTLTPTPGAVVSKECSIVVMFVMNERFTFRGFGDAGGFAVGRRFLTSNVVRAGGAAVGITVLYVLYTWFGVWYVLANVLGIGVGFVVNYTLESLATWRVHR